MYKSLNISMQTYNALWRNRQEGENNENAILARLLSCEESKGVVLPITTAIELSATKVSIYVSPSVFSAIRKEAKNDEETCDQVIHRLLNQNEC